MYASAIGVTRLVAPGPDVAIQTPTRPVACAYPVAAWPAPCSCRTRMCRTLRESNSGSYAGRIAPPGMPNTVSTPSASSERTSACAPVIGTSVTRSELTCGCAPPPVCAAPPAWAAECGRWARSSGVGLLIAVRTNRLRLVHGCLRALKNPTCRGTGVSASATVADALDEKYSTRHGRAKTDGQHVL